MDLKKLFEDKELKYYLHGTGGGKIDAAVSISKNGLKMFQGAMGYNDGDDNIKSTALPLGKGSDTLYDDTACNLLNNYPHNNSRCVVVISLPVKYLLSVLDLEAVAFMDNRIFYSHDEAWIAESERVPRKVIMPEFIAGFYDADTETFFSNKKYFKNLTKEQREEVFNKVHTNYMNFIKSALRQISSMVCPYYFRSVDEYLDICKRRGTESPLSKGDIAELRAYANKMLKLRKEKGLIDFSELEKIDARIDEELEREFAEMAARSYNSNNELETENSNKGYQQNYEEGVAEEDLTRVHSWEDVDWAADWDDDVM